MAAISSTLPASFFAGDTVQWIESQSSYRPAVGWTLELVIAIAGSHSIIQSTDNGDGRHLFTLPISFTSLLAAGVYQCVIAAVDSSNTQRHTVFTSSIQVKPSPTSNADFRSHVKRTLDALNVWIETRSQGVADYSISGRMMKYWTIDEVIKMQRHYRQLYLNEQQAQRLKSGKPSRRRVLTRMRG